MTHRRKEGPELVARQQRIPSRGPQRVNVYVRTRTFWTQDKPTVWRAPPLTYEPGGDEHRDLRARCKLNRACMAGVCVLEKVIGKEVWQLVVLAEALCGLPLVSDVVMMILGGYAERVRQLLVDASKAGTQCAVQMGDCPLLRDLQMRNRRCRGASRQYSRGRSEEST